MGAVDPGRRLVRLTAAELAAVSALLGGASQAQAAREAGLDVAELSRAGIVVEGSLHPAVAQVVAVVTAPQLVLTLETWAEGAVVVHRAWATAELAVVGRSVAEDVVEYTATDLVSVPFFLAALVGLGRRPVAGPTGPFTVSSAALDAASSMVEEGDRRAATERLVADGVPADGADTLAEVLARRRLSWRAVSTWASPTGEVTSRGVTVIDAGPAGLWRVDVTHAEPGAGTGPPDTLVLSALAPSQAWEELTALIPPTGLGPADGDAPSPSAGPGQA